MVLSPADVLAQRQQRRTDQINALETSVNQTLVDSLEIGDTPFDVDPTTNHVVVDQVVNSYRAAGWTVTTEQDFHGNKRLLFTPPA